MRVRVHTHTHTHTHTYAGSSTSRKCAVLHSVALVIFAPHWTAARQAPLSMGFSRQEYGVGYSTLLRERKYGVLSWIDANVKSVLAFKIFLICFKNIPPQNVTIAKDKWKLERLALSL